MAANQEIPARPRAYLAGPEVFLPNAKAVAARRKAVCAAHGLDGVFPLDAGLDLAGLAPAEAGQAIYRANRDLMDGCDLLIANLTPFRGPSADAGTVFELGYMRGLGRPVFGFSAQAVPFAERTRRLAGVAPDARVDAEGLEIEDFGLPDNLMIAGALADALDGMVVADEPAERRFADPAAFETCVAAAARWLADRRSG
jgi:nucleoside 2-deoxyribosyltransferase